MDVFVTDRHRSLTQVRTRESTPISTIAFADRARTSEDEDGVADGRLRENARKGYFSLTFSQFLPQPIPTSVEVRARAWPSAYNVTSARAI